MIKNEGYICAFCSHTVRKFLLIKNNGSINNNNYIFIINEIISTFLKKKFVFGNLQLALPVGDNFKKLMSDIRAVERSYVRYLLFKLYSKMHVWYLKKK